MIWFEFKNKNKDLEKERDDERHIKWREREIKRDLMPKGVNMRDSHSSRTKLSLSNFNFYYYILIGLFIMRFVPLDEILGDSRFFFLYFLCFRYKYKYIYIRYVLLSTLYEEMKVVYMQRERYINSLVKDFYGIFWG